MEMKKSNGKTLSEQLKEYFENTPKDILEAEWKELNERYPNSPTVEDWLKYNNLK